MNQTYKINNAAKLKGIKRVVGQLSNLLRTALDQYNILMKVMYEVILL
jgi:hypothetical protein